MKDILRVKEENEGNWLQIDDVHGVGLRISENKIVVYADKITPELCMMIPHQIEDYLVDIVICDMPVVHTFIGTPKGNFDAEFKRPVPAGTSIGHGNVTAGTLGSWFYNPYYNSLIALSNNHVLADVNRGKIKRSISTSFTVLDGGVYPSKPILDNHEFQGFFADVNGGKNYCTIDSVRPTSGKIGDVITITGQSLGNGWWGKRILFNGIEAEVRKWYGSGTETTLEGQFTYFNSITTTIEVYVPQGLPTGNVIITIELDGDPSVSPGMYDHGVMPTHIVGQLLDYEVLSSTQDNICDIGLMKPYYPSVINSNVYGKGANSTTTYANRNNIFPNLSYRATGFRTDPIEGLAIIKTGRTTGTTCSFIVDCYNTGSTAYVGNDGGFLIINHKNRLTYSGLYDSSGSIKKDMMFIAGGDSGSSVMTCPQDIFEQFNTAYGISVPDTVTFDPKPYQFIGNIYAGSGDGVLNASDAYREWSQIPNLALDLIDNQNMILGGYITSKSNVNIAFRMYGNGQVNNVSNSELSIYTPPTDISQVNFELTFSNDNSLPIQMTGESNSTGTASFTLLDTLYLTMGMQSSSTGTTNLTLFDNLYITIAIQSSSIGNLAFSLNQTVVENNVDFFLSPYTTLTDLTQINFELINASEGQLMMSARSISVGDTSIKYALWMSAKGNSMGNTTIVYDFLNIKNLSIASKSNGKFKFDITLVSTRTQDENLYFSINHTLELNMSITQSTDLNFAV